MQVTNHSYQPGRELRGIFYLDWMGSKIHQTAENCQTHIKQYRFDLASAEIYELVWSNFCDWYIEFNKVAIQNSEDA
jgi:valyl-tRNA synthetase